MVVPGHATFSSLLLMLSGLPYLRLYFKNLLLFSLCFILIISAVVTLQNHTSWIFTVFLAYFLLIFNSRSYLYLLIFTIPVLLFLHTYIDGFNDYNATWRFTYWTNILSYKWNQAFLLFGEGFGVPFINTEFINYDEILDQVHQNKSIYQQNTVPPHNGLLTMLYYFGLPAVILFLFPYVNFLYKAVKSKILLSSKLSFVSLSSLTFLMLTNQSLEIPYFAIIFWWVYGYFLYNLNKS
jgi:hypothetical protein